MSLRTTSARLTTCALLAAAALALAPAAQATPVTPTLAFSEPAAISAADNTIGSLQAVAGEDGSATVLWTQAGSFVDGDWTSRLMTSTRLAGQSSWSTPTELSTPNAQADLANQHGGSAADGSITVVWEEHVGTDNDVYAATRAAGSTEWSAPVRISAPDSTRGWGAWPVVRADGSAVVAWVTYNNGPGIRYATRGAGATGAWSAPKTVEAGADRFGPPALTADSAGNVSLLYGRTDTARSADIVRVATLAAGSDTFSTPQDAAVEPLHKVDGISAITLPGGDLAATWQRSGADQYSQSTVMVARRSGGVWQEPSQISTDGGGWAQSRLAADRSGNLAVIWLASDDLHDAAGYRVSMAVARPGGAWSAPFAPPGTAPTSQAGELLSAGGWVVGLWLTGTAYPTATPRFAVTSDLAAGFGSATAFGSELDLSTPNMPAYAINRSGMVVAAWQGFDYKVRASVAAAGQLPDLDPKPPVSEPTPPADEQKERVKPPLIVDPPIPAPRVRQLRLQGRRVVVNVRVTLRRGARCAGAVSAASRIGAAGRRTTHGKGLRLRTVSRDGRRVCVITGSLTLRKAPAAGQALRVAFRNPNLRLRARVATHGG